MCEKLTFQKSLEAVSGIIESRTSMPVLNNILFETLDNKTMKLSATNLEIGIECYVDADIIKQGTIMIPGKRFTSIVKELSDEIKIETVKNNMFVKSGGSDFSIVGMPRDEFPRINVNKDFILTLPQKTLKEMLERTSFAMPTDDTRYILKGVYLCLEGDTLVAVATDGKRLSYIKEEIENTTGAKKKVVIPAQSVAELKKILTNDGDVKISIDETHVNFICDNIHVVSKIIEGSYPDYEQVIPKKSETSVIINKTELIMVLKRAYYFTSDENKRIVLHGSKDSVSIKAQASGFGEFEESVKCKANTNKFDIAFNLEYFLQVIKRLEGESVTIEMSGSEKAAVIKEGMNKLFLIMPMKLSNEE